MDRFTSLARKLVEAAGLGLLAVAVLYLPPASIAPRLDAWLASEPGFRSVFDDGTDALYRVQYDGRATPGGAP